ncbi:MAG: hypothetical protein ACYS47_01080 [Planctomycetota bacterium]|jgi:hypothetical protein
MTPEKNIYLPHVLKLLWDAEELREIFSIKIYQSGTPKFGILSLTDKRALVVLENKPDHQIDFKRTLRIYSIRLTSIIEVEETEESLRISSKNHGLELFFEAGEADKDRIQTAKALLMQKKTETRSLSDIWRKFLRHKD